MVLPALFKLEPKESLDELYDFDEELRMLWEAYETSRLVAVLGLRRMGKSSLLRTFLNSRGIPHVYLDVRRTLTEEGRASRRMLMMELGRALTQFLERHANLRERLTHLLGRIQGVTVSLSPVSISLAWGRGLPSIAAILESVDQVMEEVGVKAVLAIDEVQELRGVMDMSNLLAYVYDNLRHVVVMVAGSQVGLLYDVLGLDNPESPLYGRAVYEVRLKRFTKEDSLNFLRKGFQQAGISVEEEELERAVDMLDGIVGWLTYYGWAKVTGARSLESIVDMAAQQEAVELRRFLTKSRAERRYRAILKAAAIRPMRWSELKRAVEVEEGFVIDDHNFTQLLHNLERMGMLEKTGNYYAIPDPVLVRAIQKYI